MIRAALAIFMVSTSSGALAITADDQADARCILVSGQMADSDDKEQQTAASIMLFYYLGRLEGRNPSADLVKLLEGEADQVTEERQNEILRACSARLDKASKALSSVAEKVDPAL
jgi:hypothetical protein